MSKASEKQLLQQIITHFFYLKIFFEVIKWCTSLTNLQIVSRPPAVAQLCRGNCSDQPSCPKSCVNFSNFLRSCSLTVGRVVAKDRNMSLYNSKT